MAGVGCSSGDANSGQGGAPPGCGNNRLDPGEVCDGVNFSTLVTCASVTQNALPYGNPTCNAQCTIDASGCSAGPGGGPPPPGVGGNTGFGGIGAAGTPFGTGGVGQGGTGVGGFGAGPANTGGAIATGGVPPQGGATSTGGAPMVGNAGEPVIPAAPASCPQLVTGTVTVLGKQVQLWVGAKSAKPAPILFYWHGTGGSSTEASAFMGAQINEIQSEGGLVASFTNSLGTGTNTGDNVWYTDDFNMADQILACAIQQLNIDTHQIYTGGCSAGGLQAGTMAVVRSNYIAGAMPNSGGSLISNWENPNFTPAIITVHGAETSDVVIIKFADVSKSTDAAFCKRGGWAVDCDTGGGHCGATAPYIAAQWQYLKDHPFGTTNDPYNGTLPASFPTSCTMYKHPSCP